MLNLSSKLLGGVAVAIVAQAVATSSVLTNGTFRFGVGTGEALNEHVLGDPWPEADVTISQA